MERIRTIPLVRLIHTVRARLAAALGSKKPGSTIELLGCSPEQLKAHLEKQFQPGMSWANYGLWHIDHKKPFARATDEKSVREIAHYTNLQPLWAEENLRKGSR